ncbi:Lipoprotein-anchoring transpeptidase ErfK/SrfK [Tistlia consotensis]|uniref:Lipoprotein-anchoring transpeptidase ErfK/SrfK n=1 Tax=Tistlia consotensis USBA 355 TaxID=560819 RepID=A0A1Y6CBS8_9PROT|nr:L,D-transpeptidase [Tistlia consotensis]SMF53901.1 Lipoprotein-anchoring transpeptidase ErfK/SrfK [Tistlia consotensis USBA 355]SNR86216.1 Lipoprotein-anchoring transpeptidase ErfK/SrfK [Tistlia consotensis]
MIDGFEGENVVKAVKALEFAEAGRVVVVADPGKPRAKVTIDTIEVDGKAGLVRAFDEQGRLAAFYPATVGSKDNPGPKGSHKVRTVAIDPSYTYDPEVNFTQGGVREKLEIPPGPNGPVGTVRIDLTEPTYGIHGTAEPAEIDKTWSHRCVRLTNWDADELAHLVHPGTVVTFLDGGEPAGRQRREQAQKAPAGE